METKKNLTEQDRYGYLRKMPRPDRYILLGSSCKKSNEEIKKHFTEVKAKASALPPEDIPQDKLNEFAQKYVEEQIAQILANPKYAQEGKCTFCLGSPGAGKSSIIKPLSQETMSFHADADAIKVALSQAFGIDVNGPSMHKYSGMIMKQYLIPALLDNKVNFIQEKIGDEIDKMVGYTNDYKSKGYDVSVVLIHCDNDVCRERNIQRCERSLAKGETPRIVSDEDIVQIGNTPLDTYMYLMEEHGELFESGKAYCSDVQFGTHPLHLQGMDYEKGKRVENEQTEQYALQGEHFKSVAVRNQGQIYLQNQTIDPKLAEEIQKGVEELATTGDLNIENYSKECVDALGEINDSAIYTLADVLNPSENYVENGKSYDTEKIVEAIQNHTKQQQQQRRSPSIEEARFL